VWRNALPPTLNQRKKKRKGARGTWGKARKKGGRDGREIAQGPEAKKKKTPSPSIHTRASPGTKKKPPKGPRKKGPRKGFLEGPPHRTTIHRPCRGKRVVVGQEGEKRPVRKRKGRTGGHTAHRHKKTTWWQAGPKKRGGKKKEALPKKEKKACPTPWGKDVPLGASNHSRRDKVPGKKKENLVKKKKEKTRRHQKEGGKPCGGQGGRKDPWCLLLLIEKGGGEDARSTRGGEELGPEKGEKVECGLKLAEKGHQLRCPARPPKKKRGPVCPFEKDESQRGFTVGRG